MSELRSDTAMVLSCHTYSGGGGGGGDMLVINHITVIQCLCVLTTEQWFSFNFKAQQLEIVTSSTGMQRRVYIRNVLAKGGLSGVVC